MTSRIGYNIHAQFVPDTLRLKKHLLAVQPTSLVIMDGLMLAQDLKALLPSCIVIHRNYGVTNGDDDVHLKVTPQRWLELRAKEAEGGIYLYTTNEPAFNQQSIQWHVELMELAAKQNVRLVIGNWAVGNPGPDDWAQAKPMLDLLDQHRDLFILGLHEYACGVITSGLYGGYPNNAGVQPGTAGGQNLIPADNWPDDVSKVTQWHCGRFNFLLGACAKMNIDPPRIILTEHGMDDVSDIKAWADTLLKTPGYTSIRGWKSLKSQWQLWFPQWSAERAYFEQLAWADRVIYQHSPVEGQCVFSWGHSSANWEQFDTAEASEFQAALEVYAQGSEAPAAPPPVVIDPPGLPAFPADFIGRAAPARLLPLTTQLRIRQMPSVESAILGVIPRDGVDGFYIAKAALRDSEQVTEKVAGLPGTWLPVQVGKIYGWVFGGSLRVEVTIRERFDKQRVMNALHNIQTLMEDLQAYIEESIG